MGVQLSYPTSQGAAFAGLLGSDTTASSIRSFINGDPQVNGIPFGLAMVAGAAPSQGAVDRKAVLPLAADAEFLGIGLHTIAVNNIGLGATGSNGMPQLGQLSVMDVGDVWVKVEEAVLADDQCYVRILSDGGSNTQIGSFRKSVDSGRAVRMHGAKFISAAASGKYALVNYRKPAAAADRLFTFSQAFAAAANVTRSDYLFTVPADRFLKIKAAHLYDPTGLAASDTDYEVITVQSSGAVVYKTFSTKLTGGAALAAATDTLMNAGTTDVVPPGTILQLTITKTGAPTLPAGTVLLDAYYL